MYQYRCIEQFSSVMVKVVVLFLRKSDSFRRKNYILPGDGEKKLSKKEWWQGRSSYHLLYDIYYMVYITWYNIILLMKKVSFSIVVHSHVMYTVCSSLPLRIRTPLCCGAAEATQMPAHCLDEDANNISQTCYLHDQNVLGVLTQVQAYYNIDDSMAGLIQTVFLALFMIGSPICGYLGDRYNFTPIIFK